MSARTFAVRVGLFGAGSYAAGVGLWFADMVSVSVFAMAIGFLAVILATALWDIDDNGKQRRG